MEVRVKKNISKKIVVQDLTLVSPDRNRKDTGTLKNALIRAESIEFPSRVMLYDLYHDVVSLDGHLSGIMDKRKAAILNKSLRFVDKKGRKIDAFDSLIYSNQFNDLVSLIVESKFWGLSGVEFKIGADFDFETIPRKHINIDKGVIVPSQYSSNGFPIDELSYCWVIGNKGDLGKLLQCSLYALYKRSGFGDFAQYVEIFGQPVRIIYYDAYDTKTKEDLRKLLSESGSSLAMMIPKQAEFQMLDGKTTNGTGELQTRLIDYCNREMSVAILGNSETTTASSSSGYAQAKIQAEQQAEITKSDISFVQNVLNEQKFIQILKSYGYPAEGGSFEFEQELDLDMLAKKVDIDLKVSDKVPVDDDYWYTTYGIPKPDNYEQIKKEQEEAKEQAAKIETELEPEPKDDDDSIIVETKGKNLFQNLGDFFFGKVEEINLNNANQQLKNQINKGDGNFTHSVYEQS